MITARQAPYVGSKLSLVSKQGIRYEGTLYTVDPTASTIALSDVRCFGTEDRPTRNPFAGSDDIYEYIIFNAADIDEVVVYEVTRPIVKFANGLPHDPAIVEISHCRVPGAYTYETLEQDAFERQYCQLIDPNMHLLPPSIYLWQGYPGSQGAGDGCQFWQNSDRSRASRRRKAKIRKQGVNTGFVDYDFEKANRHFDEFLKLGPKKKRTSKEGESEKELLSSRSEDGEREVENSTEGSNNNNKYYNKNVSFFDKISYNVIEAGRQAQANWYKEQAKNEETFGEATMRSYRFYVNRRHARARDANNQPLWFC
uniref:Protein LSM14 B n=1 Tax=Ascaris suum TaxID=6253 RepID=F1L295_ASCSU